MSASSAGSTKAEPGLGTKAFAILQRVGKSLMLPIAVLPAAGILLRLGQGDLLGGIGESGPEVGDGPFSILSAAGGAIFANLAFLFAVGVAVGSCEHSGRYTAMHSACLVRFGASPPSRYVSRHSCRHRCGHTSRIAG